MKNKSKLLKWRKKNSNEYIGHIDKLDIIEVFQLADWSTKGYKKYWVVRTKPKSIFPSRFEETKHFTLSKAKKAGETLYHEEFKKMVKHLIKITQ